MDQIQLQQVVDLTSLFHRHDVKAIQVAFSQAKVKSPFLNRLVQVLDEKNQPQWQLDDLQKQTLFSSVESLSQVKKVLFDNKIWFKTLLRTPPYSYAKPSHSAFYYQSVKRLPQTRYNGR